jgi:hypothetical protein
VLTSPDRRSLVPLLDYVDHLLAVGEHPMVTILIPPPQAADTRRVAV